jgi:hypothetical protein
VRSRWVAPLIPVAVSLSLGTAWHSLSGTPKPESDALLYHWLASALAGFGPNHTGLDFAVDGMAVRGWTQSALMGALYAVVGHPAAAAFAWLQAVAILPATTGLVYLAGRAAFDRTTGLVAAWAFALWFPLVYYTTWVMPETTTGLVVAGALVLLSLVVTRPSIGWAAVCGAAFGLLSLTHSGWQFAGVVTAVAVLVHFWVYDRDRICVAVALLAVVVGILASYTVVRVATDLPRPGQGGVGYGAGGAWGVWTGSRSFTDFLPVPDDYTIANENAPGGVVHHAQLIRTDKLQPDRHLSATILDKAAGPDASTQQITDSDFLHAGFANLLDHPGAWPRKTWVGLKRLFLPNPNLVFYAAPVKATWFRHPWRTVAVPLLGLTVAGLVLLLASRRDRLVLFVPLVAQTVIFLVGVPEPRYSYPLVSSMMLLAAFAALALARSAARLAVRLRAHYSPAQ